MQKSYPKWVVFLYGPMFRVIGFFYRSYTANRARVERFKTRENVARFFKLLTVVVLAAWILVWMIAPDESRNRLTEEVRQTLGGFAPKAKD